MAPMTRLEPGAPSLRAANIARLELLAGELARRGVEASPIAPPARVPRLVVRHPSGLSEEVYAGRGEDGSWWFWWPWAERIALASELERAAARIDQVLSSAPARQST